MKKTQRPQKLEALKINAQLLKYKSSYYSRLQFPSSNDSGYIPNVGRKHFKTNSSSLQKILNPQADIMSSNNKIQMKGNQGKVNIEKQILQRKLNLIDNTNRTQPNQQINVQQYQVKNRREKTQVIQPVLNNYTKDAYKLKTERASDQPNIEQLKIIRSLSNNTRNIKRQEIFPFSTNHQLNYDSTNMEKKKNQILFANKIELRKFNPTYMSTNF